MFKKIIKSSNSVWVINKHLIFEFTKFMQIYVNGDPFTILESLWKNRTNKYSFGLFQTNLDQKESMQHNCRRQENSKKQGQGNQCQTPEVKFWANAVKGQ